MGASSLETGAAYLREHLGANIPRGGKHSDMGTHNCVMRVGTGLFLELLSVDPEAAPPARPRWFGMDDPRQVARMTMQPRPVGWVVQTEDIEQARRSCPVDPGPIVSMSRGSRSWLITLPDSGKSPFDGLFPAFIQWPEGPHPSAAMSAPGPALSR
ncbi:hypothetical protein GCM10007276_05510 [Agaricicola taiwanensis]|uniref:Glyoxalase-like domain-containing protein n=2 Tax=Agaricicola taiwanensis TaxID=591372 RepID=A0A8J2VLM6_9RHOB|nr:hypothetical protein GCM10007276_05510 [Agaricicola taiwanensis]